ncbi:MAG TPA: universal stress protein [Myxococcota bacterium]|nr:universal stress protein [Myxococcota bacterium]
MTPQEAGKGGRRLVTVATDFSAGAETALSRALTLPLADGATLRVLHILPNVPKRIRPTAHREARVAGERFLGSAREGAGRGRELRWDFDVLEGRHFVEIVRDVRRSSSELLVLGRHGRRPLRDLFLGTVADRVVRTSPVPVLVVNARPTRAYARPLVAVDFEGASEGLLDALERVLGPTCTTARAFHAFDVPFESLIAPNAPPRGESDYRRECRERAQSQIGALLARRGASAVRYRGVVRSGDPRDAILCEARRYRADLIALGTHGRPGIAHALLGSVAEWVVRAGPCDVLEVRPVGFRFELP